MESKAPLSFEGLVEALQKDLQTFSYHLFNARWQWEQYKNISTDVPENTIVFCMDFGEIIITATQDGDFCMCNAEMCTEIGLTASDCI